MTRKLLVFMVLALLPSLANAWEWGGSLAAGAVVGPMSWDGPTAGGSGHVHLVDTLAGASVGVGLTGAAPVSDAVQLGLTAELGLSIGLNQPVLGYTSYDLGGHLVGMLAAVIHRPGSRLVLRFGAGAAATGFSGGGVDVGSPNNVAEHPMLLGPLAQASVGTRAFAVEARVGWFTSEHMRYVPVSLVARVHFGGL